jgi:asparagine synthase (glutamine-hydrolysing)
MSGISSDKIPVLKNKYNFHNRYEKLKNLLNDPSAKNMLRYTLSGAPGSGQ